MNSPRQIIMGFAGTATWGNWCLEPIHFYHWTIQNTYDLSMWWRLLFFWYRYIYIYIYSICTYILYYIHICIQAGRTWTPWEVVSTKLLQGGNQCLEPDQLCYHNHGYMCVYIYDFPIIYFWIFTIHSCRICSAKISM